MMPVLVCRNRGGFGIAVVDSFRIALALRGDGVDFVGVSFFDKTQLDAVFVIEVVVLGTIVVDNAIGEVVNLFDGTLVVAGSIRAAFIEEQPQCSFTIRKSSSWPNTSSRFL